MTYDISEYLCIDTGGIFICDINMVDHCLIVAEIKGYHVSKWFVGN